GIALSADGATAYVCLSIANSLAVVDLAKRTSHQISVGLAPWDVVLSPNGSTAYVSDWGGRAPTNGEPTATSAGSAVVIDNRGVAASGAVSFVSLAGNGAEIAQVATGLHPSDLELSADGSTLYVANANSDTVTVIDTQTRAIKETILVRPDPTSPFGS